MKRAILAAVLLAGTALASPASADVILGGQNWTGNGTILTLTPVVPGGNQPRNIPCLICGENQPQQKDFGYNDFGNSGNQTTINAFSSGVVRDRLADDTIGTGYSIGAGSVFLAALAGRTDFSVGVDINDTGTAQTLESFWFLNLTQHTVLAAFSPGPGGVEVPSQNNGTGFPDYTISGFDINRGDIALGDQIIFFARITGANDGPDSFFLVPNVAAVPGPIAGAGLPGLVAACMTLFGLGRYRRRRHGLA
jgi:hypothetical protein